MNPGVLTDWFWGGLNYQVKDLKKRCYLTKKVTV